jgi:bifunctional DNA-binding transcriptional regulator/antitoxin component of YhaV-PrlF toxin-antitoxin module
MKKISQTILLVFVFLIIVGCTTRNDRSIVIESHFIPFPQLFWQADSRAFTDVAAPLEYDIQIARDVRFREVVDEDRVALARYVPDRPLAVGTYYWRVRPVPAGQSAGAWSTMQGFEILPPDEVVTVDFDPAADNHQPAVQAAMERALELNRAGSSVEVRFPAGTYRGRGVQYFFELDGANRLIVNGEGVKLHLLEYRMGTGRILDSQDVLVHGFTIDHPEQRTSLQARVLEIEPGNSSIIVELDEASDTYEAEYARQGISHFSLLDPEIDGRLKTGAANFFPMAGEAERIEERRFRLPLRRLAGIEVGDRLIHFVRKGGTSLFYGGNSQRLTYYQITNYSNGGGHYVGVSCSQIAILHCRSTILGDRWYGANADGVHIRGNRIGPWVEGVEINAIGDDGVALYSRPVRASQTWPDGQRNALIITREFFDLEPGDNVSFFNPEEGRIFLETRVKAITPAEKNFRVVFEDDIPRKLAFGKSLQDDDQIWNRSTSNGDFMIRNSRFTNIRRFGVVFRAATGVVENCVFDATSSSAILFFNETQYPNGLYCSDIIIRNNTMNDCAFDSQPLGVLAMEFRRRQMGQLAADHGPRRILFENNHITNSDATPIELGSARDVVLRGNTVDGQPLDPENSDHSSIRNSKNVRWE